MANLCWALGLPAAAFAFHLALWRFHRPHRQTRALLLIFIGLPLIMSLAAIALAPPAWRVLLPVGPADWAQVALFGLVVALAYTISHTAVEADSPTLVMIRAVAAAGPEGLPAERLVEFASDAVLIQPRLDDLVRDGHLRREGEHYVLTAKGRGLAGIFILQRRIFGLGQGG